MVLKFETDPEEVFLIDAVIGKGVRLNKWRYIRSEIGTFQEY